MEKSGLFIALLLVAAIFFLPFGNPQKTEVITIITESPQTVCGDSSSQNELQNDEQEILENELHETENDNENDSAGIIAIVVVVIIIIFIIYCFTGADNQS
jgi:Na+/H+ antiporter NhaC